MVSDSPMAYRFACVEEIDAGIQAIAHELVGVGLRKPADHLIDGATSAKCHGSEAETRYKYAGIA